MPEVTTVYEFQVVASRGASAETIAREAWRQGFEFFDAEDFELEVDVRGRKGQWEVMGTATRVLEVSGEGGQ